MSSVCQEKNFAIFSRDREQGWGKKHVYRMNLRAFRQLVLKSNFKYEKVWEKTSQKRIFTNSHNIYFDNYTSCYGGNGYDGRPVKLYDLEDLTPYGKIEDVILFAPIPDKMPMAKHAHRSTLFALTKNSWLLRIDGTTGQVMEKVYLHEPFRVNNCDLTFKHLAWNVNCESFVLKTTFSKTIRMANGQQIWLRRELEEEDMQHRRHSRDESDDSSGNNDGFQPGAVFDHAGFLDIHDMVNERTGYHMEPDSNDSGSSSSNSELFDHYQPAPGPRQTRMARVAHDIIYPKYLLVIALFNALPLQFIAMMEIETEIFGRDVKDAFVSLSVLITYQQCGTMTLYSMEHVLKQYKLFDVSLFDTYNCLGKKAGVFPDGLPVNIKFTEKPPVLHQLVSCKRSEMSVGGFPWHCLSTKKYPAYKSIYKLTSLVDGEVAEDGYIETRNSNLDFENVFFAEDDSGRIMHVNGVQLRVLSLVPNGTPDKSRLKEDFKIDVRKKDDSNAKTRRIVTSSGRVVKQQINHNDAPLMAILSEWGLTTVFYEDELDVMEVSCSYYDQDRESFHSYVLFYDNLTGKMLKEIPLQIVDDEEFNGERVYTNLDTIVEVLSFDQHRFTVNVYRLRRDEPEASGKEWFGRLIRQPRRLQSRQDNDNTDWEPGPNIRSSRRRRSRVT